MNMKAKLNISQLRPDKITVRISMYIHTISFGCKCIGHG